METYYILVRNGNIIGAQTLPVVDKDVKMLEVSKLIFDEYEKYIYLNGELLRNPEYEKNEAKKEAERIARLSLTKRELFLALYDYNKTTPETVRTLLADNPKGLIEFDYAERYYRGNPLIDLIGMQIGVTSEQLDYLFENGVLKNDV